jgi:hypothetical protein
MNPKFPKVPVRIDEEPEEQNEFRPRYRLIKHSKEKVHIGVNIKLTDEFGNELKPIIKNQ